MRLAIILPSVRITLSSSLSTPFRSPLVLILPFLVVVPESATMSELVKSVVFISSQSLVSNLKFERQRSLT